MHHVIIRSFIIITLLLKIASWWKLRFVRVYSLEAECTVLTIGRIRLRLWAAHQRVPKGLRGSFRLRQTPIVFILNNVFDATDLRMT